MAVPNHLAIIPDGNRRWAKLHQINPLHGHLEGTKRFWDVADFANEIGVKYITFWAASYDNFVKRSKLEVKFLIDILRNEVAKPEFLERCIKNNTRFQLVGEWKEVIRDLKLIKAVEEIESKTAKYTQKVLTILFVYDGQREMIDTINRLVVSGKKVTKEVLHSSLWTKSLPEVDLVIRTGGEPHWSAGFMMWHTAHSQFYFTDKLWPDFKNMEIKKALAEYERRERRMGK